MTGAGFEIRIDADPVVQGLRRLRELGGDLTPVMDDIGAMLVASTQHRFETGTGPDGTSWPESARAKRQGGQTLVDSGRLRDSITHRARGDTVEVGTNVIYAAIHQFGGTIKPKNAKSLAFPGLDGAPVFVKSVTLPARPFLGVSNDDREEIAAIVADEVARSFGGTP